MKTSLEEIKEEQGIFSNVKVDRETFDAVMRASKNCPRLYQMLVSGQEQSNIDHRLIKPITTLVCYDSVLRFWRYDDFALDFMLSQQFNYESKIYLDTNRRDCKHIAQAHDIWLFKYAAIFNI